jgi:hypothetical protein
MKNNYKKFSILLIINTIVLSLIAVPILNYSVDPLEYFRESKVSTQGLYPRRYELYRKIQYLNYDYILMGTSMLNSFDEEFTSKVLNGRVIRLNMAGSSAYEQSQLVDLAIKRNPKVKIIWEVTLHVFSYPSKYLSSEAVFPLWLYDDFRFKSIFFKYLVNFDTLKKSIKLFKSNVKGQDAYEKAKIYKEKLTKNLALKYLKIMKDQGGDIFPRSSVNLIPSFDESILRLSKKYPENKFIVFYSPQSRYYFLGLSYIWKNAVDNIIDFKKHLAQSSFDLGNVELHDFQTDLKTLSDRDNYADATHHNHVLANQIIDKLKTKEELVTPTNLKEKLLLFKKVFD